MATKTKTEEAEQQAAEQQVAEPTFTKRQILKSHTYAKRVDILNVLLNDKKSYSHKEVQQILDAAFSGKYQIK